MVLIKHPLVLSYCSLRICVPFSDVDECSASSPVCDSNANCSNTRGSYICTCRAGYTGDGKTCQGRFENVKLTQRVRDVFLYTNQKQISPIVLLKHPLVFPYCSLVICVPFSDVDECSASSPVCDSNAICSNTRGSYICTCRAGYTGDGKTCQGRFENVRLTQRVREVFLYTNRIKILLMVLLKHPLVFPYCSLGICVPFSDVDECSASSPVCDSNANCSNTRGSYICTCKSGYTGDGKTCQGRFFTSYGNKFEETFLANFNFIRHGSQGLDKLTKPRCSTGCT